MPLAIQRMKTYEFAFVMVHQLTEVVAVIPTSTACGGPITPCCSKAFSWPGTSPRLCRGQLCKVPVVQLLAAYAGNSFTTQGLLLLDRHSGQSMEITAEDCSWRVKEKTSPWRKAQVELLSAEDGTTSLQVKKLHEKLGETKMLRSAILLQMESESDMKNIGKLVVHCRPQNHLDFKMAMFQKSDVNHVGGELGVAPDGNNNYHFLFSKQGMMRMRADQEFKAGMIQKQIAKDGDTCPDS